MSYISLMIPRHFLNLNWVNTNNKNESFEGLQSFETWHWALVPGKISKMNGTRMYLAWGTSSEGNGQIHQTTGLRFAFYLHKSVYFVGKDQKR